LKGVWVPHDTRVEIVDFVHRWSSKTGITALCLLLWIGLSRSKWHDWKKRYGKVNEHNAWIPRDHWWAKRKRRLSWTSTSGIPWRAIGG
jgi:hypothetical protein